MSTDLDLKSKLIIPQNENLKRNDDSYETLKLIGPNFWNVRSKLLYKGIVDIGTQMSIIRLINEKFIILSTIPLNQLMKQEIKELTNNGTLIEAVIATHPFHTLSFISFYETFQNENTSIAYYGTPRHLKIIDKIPWKGSISDENIRNQWINDSIHMKIPNGCEFNEPKDTNHFSSVLIYHKISNTIHIDDTFLYTNPEYVSFFMSCCLNIEINTLKIHRSFKEALDYPLLFIEWFKILLNEWIDIKNIVFAHNGLLLDNGYEKLSKLYENIIPILMNLENEKIIERNKVNSK